MFAAVVCPPDVVIVAFHAWVTCCPEGNVQASRQLVTGSPRLVTFTSAVNPPVHWDETVYVTRQPAAACAWKAVIVPMVSSAITAATTAPTLERAGRDPCGSTVVLLGRKLSLDRNGNIK
ncbi:hypothetical protein GCM10009677_44500 [Sphaerisporangium rubeum]